MVHTSDHRPIPASNSDKILRKPHTQKQEEENADTQRNTQQAEGLDVAGGHYIHRNSHLNLHLFISPRLLLLPF